MVIGGFRGAVHPACCDRQDSSPREKSKRPPHHVQESADADLDPDVTAEDLVSVSPFPQLERTGASGRTGSQTVGAMPGEESDAAPIPVRITLRGADSMLDKAKTRGDAGENGKKHEPGDKRPVNRFPAKGEEIGKAEMQPVRVLSTEPLEKFVKVLDNKPNLTGDSTGRGGEPRGVSTGRGREPRGDSTGRGGESRGVSTGRGREPRGVSTGREREPRGVSTGRTGKDDLARELSRSSALSERERQRRQRHREKRSAAILAKRDKLMKIYKMDCEAFATVAKQLIAQDASLEERVALAVKKSLQLIGERCLAELKETIAKWDAANVLKKRR
ncbi:uncharacterized protein [Mobula birostris]|uniref:uncharacterized protein n=1 Tax=Mobula birostris TaxID=1983395 RepID=UPI003B28A02E